MDRYNGFFCQCPPAWKVGAGGGRVCGWGGGCGVNNKLIDSFLTLFYRARSVT